MVVTNRSAVDYFTANTTSLLDDAPKAPPLAPRGRWRGRDYDEEPVPRGEGRGHRVVPAKDPANGLTVVMDKANS